MTDPRGTEAGTEAFEEDVIVIATQESAGYDEATGSGVAVTDAAAPAAGDGQWSEIKAMFVDDPGESVQRASGLVEQAIEGLMVSVRQRQGSLTSSWQEGDATGTEALRTALRGYRGMYEQLEQMSGQFSAAAGS